MRSFLGLATAPDWITAGIATLALSLSAYSLYLQWRDREPWLRLSITGMEQRFHRTGYDALTDHIQGEHQTAIVAQVANVGVRPVALKDGFLRPVVGRPTRVGLIRDFGPDEVAPDSSREVYAFIQGAVNALGPIARRVGLYRFEVRDHMNRRWVSQVFRVPSSLTVPTEVVQSDDGPKQYG